MKHKILVIDDEPLDLSSIHSLLGDQGYHVKATLDPDEGIAYIRQNRGKVSLAIVDFALSDSPSGPNGATVTKQLLEIDPRLQIATYSGQKGDEAFESTLAAGSRYFIEKGVQPRKLQAIVKTFCDRFEEAHKVIVPPPVTAPDVARIETTGLTGCSRNLVDVTERVYTFAGEDGTVLIRGENGTGKEPIARAIHNFSNRRGPFIAVNCAAIPFDLLESELFGHEKGAFSGATRDKVGLVMAANNGTIFLDEIGDMPMLLQVKILRFLQEDEVRSVGSETTTKVNVRVIAATNVNLEAAVKSGRFREDLYYRIKVLQINVLPLRERKEDIRPLVLRFSSAFAKKKGIKKEFLEETVKLLESHDWPGNIRELEHEVETAMLCCKGVNVLPEHIDPKIRQVVEEKGQVEISDADVVAFEESQRDRARQFYSKGLEKAGGSVRKLAREIFKISNSTLQARLKALGIVIAKHQPNKGV